MTRTTDADGTLSVTVGNDRSIGGAVAAAVAWYTEDLLATIVFGMVGSWILTLVP